MRIALLFLIWIAFASCTSGLKQVHSFAPPRPGNGRTVVLFLVDGLVVSTLQSGLNRGLMPSTDRYFLRGARQFSLGRAAFPSLTYPNISSILTVTRIGEQPVISNHVLYPNGRIINFESHEFHPLLRATVDPVSVIGRLEAQGIETASFSYVFGLNARSHMRVGMREGMEYSRHDYQSLDERLITSLEEFLASRPNPETWPAFIYVHLVGVDGVSHRFGPASQETREYLAWLDARLSGVLGTLAQADRSRQKVLSILTADHGFVQTKRHVKLGLALQKSDLGVIVTNEARFLGLHLPDRADRQKFAALLEQLGQVPGVEITAWRNRESLDIALHHKHFRFALGPALCTGEPASLALVQGEENGVSAVSAAYRCASDFDRGAARYPFLVADLVRFLSAPGHPDALVIGAPDVSFAEGARGNHGGPTAEEMLVPVLLRNARLATPRPRPTSSLLEILLPSSVAL